MDNWYLALMGKAPQVIPHWEHWSDPDAETYLTGIDYYDHPKLCRERLKELYPQLNLGIPADDTPKPRPTLDLVGESSKTDDAGKHYVRWGEGTTGHWDWGTQFRTAEDVFAFSPLEHAADFAHMEVVEKRDYSDEEALYRMYLGDRSPDAKAEPGSGASAWFYNTMFMWPLLTFGWELFLECCMDDRFEPIMHEFREINRRVFRAFARLPVNFIICHDDIVTTRGPVCSPAWMHKYVFPCYEEYWALLKASGKEVIFMVDGCVDAFADDVMACGARGIISEPFTDYKAIARKYDNPFVAGEGDNRILMRNDPAEIRAMVDNMVETSKMTGGYMMCVGNHIPWNVPGEAIKVYLDYAAEVAHR